MNDSKVATALAMMDYFCNSDMPAAHELRTEIARELNRADRLQRYEEYSKNIHENCIYCRKKCKLFKENKCFNKSSEEQVNCEHFDNSYVSIRK